MRRFAGYAIVALALLLAGEAVRRAADLQRHVVAAKEQVARLSLEAADVELGAVERSMAFARSVPVIGTALMGDVRQQRATVAYWRAQYATLPSSDAELSSKDIAPDLIFLSANAAFRTAEAQPAPQALKALDQVLKAYTILLKKSPGHPDGTYNYEYVVRVRNALAHQTPGAPMRAGATDPSGAPVSVSTLHGDEGSPPPNAAPNNFNVVVPLQPEERGELIKKAGTGAVKARKG